MKTLKYVIVLLAMGLLALACSEDVKDTPPRLTDINDNFILPIPPRLTNAEQDMVQAKRDAYDEAYGD
ncbi:MULTISPECIES: hypothetical protein [Butyricimonas]|uniref:hypothetical protein n=1 Tax=Butyricimonas TaxID=574697 RepID=UPI0007FB51FD|nr:MULTISPECIES: hypothetical protein [Butyricimonas]